MQRQAFRQILLPFQKSSSSQADTPLLPPAYHARHGSVQNNDPPYHVQTAAYEPVPPGDS